MTRKKQIAPPYTCDAGVVIPPFGECPVCGATGDEDCGKRPRDEDDNESGLGAFFDETGAPF